MSAPRRGKSGRRRVLIALVILALVCAGTGVMIWPYMAANAPAPDRENVEALNRLVAYGQPEGENGWDELRRFLVDEIGTRETRTALGETLSDPWTDPMEVLNHPWEDPRLSVHREALEKIRPHLSVLDHVAARDCFFIPYRGDGLPLSDAPDASPVSMEPPSQGLSGLRRLVLWNAVAMREAAERGDWKGATDRLRVGLAVAERTSRQALFIEWLIGMSLHGLATLEMRRELNELEVPSHVCAEWLQLLDSHRWPVGEVDRVVDGEALFGASFYRGMFSESGVPLRWRFERHRDGYDRFFGGTAPSMEPPPSLLERLGNVRAIRDLPRAEVEGMRVAAVERVRAVLKGKPPAESGAAELQSRGLRAFLFPPDDIAEMLDDTVRSSHDFRGQLQMTTAFEAGAKAMLRLEMFHAEHGRWPKSLVEAMDEAEAVDPSSGVPFEYEVSADEGRPYVLRLGRSAQRQGLGYGPAEFEVNPVRPGGELASEGREEWDEEMEE